MAESVKRVVFLHPDMGIGGAERLVVDAALALQKGGHSVRMFTAHHDVTHCFPETVDGTLRLDCIGDWLPRDILGRGRAICAYLRMVYIALYLSLFSGHLFDLVFIDLVSVAVPLVKLFNPRVKVLFYCHFPDQLLTDRRSLLKRIYRWPIDRLEEHTTGMADCVLVNSNFTAEVFRSTFHSLTHVEPKVLYPAQSLEIWNAMSDLKVQGLDVDLDAIDHLFLSINRYERKKNVDLAIEALAELRERLSPSEWSRTHLIVAGGYDPQHTENRLYHAELEQLAESFGVSDHVSFLLSFSDSEKRFLLDRCTCLLYTPDREHFGIVPIEAMHAGKPVVAVNSGGPMETILHGESGFLCPPTPFAFANAMERFTLDSSLAHTMGIVGQRHVHEHFGLEAFQLSLNRIVAKLLACRRQNCTEPHA